MGVPNNTIQDVVTFKFDHDRRGGVIDRPQRGPGTCQKALWSSEYTIQDFEMVWASNQLDQVGVKSWASNQLDRGADLSEALELARKDISHLIFLHLPVINLRTTTSQKCEAVPRRARI